MGRWQTGPEQKSLPFKMPFKMPRKTESNGWHSVFGQFVSAYGVALLAARLHVEPSAVYHWMRGDSCPHPETAVGIQRLAHRRGVALSLDTIYEHFSTLGRNRWKRKSRSL